ncbi:putative hpcH/HpaI aldolase/citrate lyase domain, pyruvate kinase-like domain superfamily [Helianthus anomalus]
MEHDPTPVIIRLPESDPAWANKALDLGPQGIMFPMIENQKMAKKGFAHTVGVKKIEDIAMVGGVDCVQMGSLDLGASMGYLCWVGLIRLKKINSLLLADCRGLVHLFSCRLCRCGPHTADLLHLKNKHHLKVDSITEMVFLLFVKTACFLYASR